jgi:hypothetical protein
MKTSLPEQAMPLEKPLARAQPGGCRICGSFVQTFQLERWTFPVSVRGASMNSMARGYL